MLRILINHPNVDIAFVHSTSNAGNHVYDVHTDLFGDTDLKFAAELAYNIDVLFLCVGHGDAKKFLEANPIPAEIKIIDLSQDFRLSNDVSGHKTRTKTFIYGLPELNREAIKQAQTLPIRLLRHLPATWAITVGLKRATKGGGAYNCHHWFNRSGAKPVANITLYLEER